MKTIALFISGRLTCYEHLIHNLELLSTKYTVDLFCSINNIRDEYHQNAETLLSRWLRGIRYEEYRVPDEDIFVQNTHPETFSQIVENKKVPYTNLSCFYNDFRSYEMIKHYSEENNIHYDICIKFRADIYFINEASLLNLPTSIRDDTLYSCIPPCEIYFWGDRRTPRCISDAFAYGSMQVMKQYCNTYNFILNTNKERNGYYRINYEPCVTEAFCEYAIVEEDTYQAIINMYANAKYRVEYFYAPYESDRTRRSRDTILCI